jgi:hypothetical protein
VQWRTNLFKTPHPNLPRWDARSRLTISVPLVKHKFSLFTTRKRLSQPSVHNPLAAEYVTDKVAKGTTGNVSKVSMEDILQSGKLNG